MAFNFEFLFVLAVVYGTGYALQFLERYGIPLVAIEILAGVVFGSVLGVVSPGTHGVDFLTTLAAFGLLLIMFEAGLELEPRIIQENPVRVGILGAATFAIPFAAGVGLAMFLGLDLFAGFLVGVTVSTTSLGLVHPLLQDFDLLERESGQIILSVTGVNDVLSIVALAYGIAATGNNALVGVGAVTLALVVFFVVIPTFFLDSLSEIGPTYLEENPVKLSVLVTILLAFATELLGIHAVLGGFFAGLLLGEISYDGPDLYTATEPLITVVAAAFFFYVGMNVTVGGFTGGGLTLVALVVAVGIGAKVISSVIGGVLAGIGWSNTALLAATMPGRLSISVAAAEIGLRRGLLSSDLYNAFIVLSTLSVFASALAFQYLAGSGTGGGANAPASDGASR